MPGRCPTAGSLHQRKSHSKCAVASATRLSEDPSTWRTLAFLLTLNCRSTGTKLFGDQRQQCFVELEPARVKPTLYSLRELLLATDLCVSSRRQRLFSTTSSADNNDDNDFIYLFQLRPKTTTTSSDVVRVGS